MIPRALLSLLLSAGLVLASLTATVAETRMAAAGSYCGTGSPDLLLDAAGLPILDGSGTAITAPDCPACLLTIALPMPMPPGATPPTRSPYLSDASFASSLTPLLVLLGGHARGPPRLA